MLISSRGSFNKDNRGQGGVVHHVVEPVCDRHDFRGVLLINRELLDERRRSAALVVITPAHSCLVKVSENCWLGEAPGRRRWRKSIAEGCCGKKIKRIRDCIREQRREEPVTA